MPEAKIDSKGKTILVAAQPPINNDPNDLDAAFWTNLDAALTALANAGTPFKLFAPWSVNNGCRRTPTRCAPWV